MQKSTEINADLAATILCISLSTWGKYSDDYAIHVTKKGMIKNRLNFFSLVDRVTGVREY